MSAWIVYSKDGKTERCRLKALEYSGSFMADRAVTATFEHHSEVAFEVFDYIVYRGEKFELESVPSVKKTSSDRYEYELRFVSLKYELERCEMRDIVPNDNGVVYPTPLTFSFTGDVRYLAERIQVNLDALYGEGVWHISVAENTTSEEKNITIGQQNCWNALSLVNTTYGLNFSVRGREVLIGGELDSVNHEFQYGKGNGLYEIERASDTEIGIVTKLRAYGGTRNLDYSYPKKPEWADSVLPVSFALSPLRLMLPSFKEDGKTDFVLADEATIAKYGIRESSIIYEDIYPSITGATNANGEAIDEIAGVDEIDETKNTFTVYLRNLGFDLNEHLTTSEAQISMKTGTLQGYTFTITAIELLGDGRYKLTLGRNSLENSEESGAYVPSKNWNMKAGDKFVLLNILMPQAYIREAEQRLLARAKEYLAEYGKTNFSYNVGLHDKFLIEHPSVYDSLIEGVKLHVYDEKLGIREEVTIQSITITENSDDNILPQVKVTLNNKPSASTLDRIQGKLNDIANETAANGFSSQSELMKQYRKKLDKPFFDKLFSAVDADGNEIASNDMSTPIAYIKAKYDFLVLGGVTMYGDDGSLDLPSIYEGLPIDNVTLYWDKGVLKAKGGEGGGGVADSIDWVNVYGEPSWITDTKPIYNYSEIKNTPDLSVFVTGTALNKTLDDYATLTYLTGELKKYVTIKYDQYIVGVKNFLNGIKISNMPIRKLQDDVIYIDANLVVRGGVTMYADGGSLNIPSIYDGLPIDGVTLVWEETADGKVLKINPNIELGGGLDEGELNAYLTNNNYAKKSDITSALSSYATTSSLNAVSTKLNDFLEGSDTDTVINKWKELETFLSGLSESDNLATILSTKWTTDNNLINQWNTAYGWGNHASVGYALKSYVDNNFVTLGTKQTITGEKNFTGGLKVNGSPIYYDATNKYWKLEGDLLVTGGVTMYGSDGFDFGSIFDEIPIDGDTIYWSNGVLKSKSNSGGGGSIKYPLTFTGAVSATYDGSSAVTINIPTAGGSVKMLTTQSMTSSINSIDSYAGVQFFENSSGGKIGSVGQYDSVLNCGYKTRGFQIKGRKDSTLLEFRNVLASGYGDWMTFIHSGNYSSYALPLSGGTIYSSSGAVPLFINSTYANQSGMIFRYSNVDKSQVGWQKDHGTRLYDYGSSSYISIKDGVFKFNTDTILHSGNYSSYALPKDGNSVSATRIQAYTHNSDSKVIISGTRTDNTFARSLYDDGWGLRMTRQSSDGVIHNGYIATLNDNVASATKLQTARTIWGQSFDGTGNVSGNIYIPNNSDIVFKDSVGTDRLTFSLGSNNNLAIGYGTSCAGYSTIIYGNSIILKYGTSRIEGLRLNSSGNLGINTDSPTHKLHVNGTLRVDGSTLKSTYLNLNRNSEDGTIYDSTKTALEVEALADLSLLRTYNVTTQAKLSLHKNGCIGIGTLSPSYMLDVDGDFRSKGIIIEKTDEINRYGGDLYIQHRGTIAGSQGSSRTGNIIMCTNGGNVGIGTTSPAYKLDVNGTIRFASKTIWGQSFDGTGNVDGDIGGSYFFISDSSINPYFKLVQGSTWYLQGANGYLYLGAGSTKSLRIDSSGNCLSVGGITMYSDIRKKTKLQDVELSLSQIANAPLIQHYYNSDQDKTTHVGSIAQYWAGLNDWFCKLDNEGFYTMEIQNCALASAISIARHLEKYESKTDKKIRMLKKRITELEDKLEKLEGGNYGC